MDALSWLVIGTLTALWRCAWCGILLPAWRVLRMLVLAAAGAWAVNRLEREFEVGAYQPEEANRGHSN